MRDALTKALTWALTLEPDPAILKWSAAGLGAVFFGLVFFALIQYQTSERRWGVKLVLGLLGGGLVVGLGTSAFHWVTGALYGIGYLLTWLAWVMTSRWSWWRQALTRGLTAGLTIGPWLWLGATEKAMLDYVGQAQDDGMRNCTARWLDMPPDWLLAPKTLIWFWMIIGILWLLVLVGGGCWSWPLPAPRPTSAAHTRPRRRRTLVVAWAVLVLLGLNWYFAGRVDLRVVCVHGQHWRLGYVLVSRPGIQWYRDVGHRTPLHLVAEAWTPRVSVLRLLLAVGSNVCARANGGATPLHSAATEGHTEMMRLLLAAGADIHAKDDHGWTPLHRAAQNANTASWEVNDTALRLLLGAGVRVNERNAKGKTALDQAGNDECRDVLRQAGGKTGAELDAEKAKAQPAPVPVEPKP